MANQRKQYLINPSFQLGLITKFAAGIVIAAIAFGFFMFQVAKNGTQEIIYSEIREIYLSQIRYTLTMLVAMVLCGVIAIYTFGIMLTHRIAGPLIPIQRFIQQLIEGNLEVADIKLRKTDELQELASQLNDLKASLQKK